MVLIHYLKKYQLFSKETAQGIIVSLLISQSIFHCLVYSHGAGSYKLVTCVANRTLRFVSRRDCRGIVEWRVSLFGSGVFPSTEMVYEGETCRVPCPIFMASVCSPKVSLLTQSWWALGTPGIALANEVPMLQVPPCTYLPASAQLYIGWVFPACQVSCGSLYAIFGAPMLNGWGE